MGEEHDKRADGVPLLVGDQVAAYARAVHLDALRFAEALAAQTAQEVDGDSERDRARHEAATRIEAELRSVITELERNHTGEIPGPGIPPLRDRLVQALENANHTHPCPVTGSTYWTGCYHPDGTGSTCHSERRASAVLDVLTMKKAL